MPIKGLTDRGLSFAQIGVIRKGAPKTENAPGKDLPYFRVEFDEKQTDAIAAFHAAYESCQGKPTQLRVYLPFNELDRCWDAWLEGYTASRLVARSDGEWFIWWADRGEILVRNGKAMKDFERAIVYKTDAGYQQAGTLTAKEGQPVPYYDKMVVSKDKTGKSVFCKPSGRLKVVLPELNRLAFLVLTTTSLNDIATMSSELEGIKALCNQVNHGIISGVDIILRRTPKKVSVPDPKNPGERMRMTKYMIDVEVDPTWVSKAFGASRQLAAPSFAALPAPQEIDAAIVEDDEYEDDIPADVDYGDASDIQPEPAAQPATEQPKPEAPKQPPAQVGTFDGMITPVLLVEAGLSESVPAAAQLINKLHIAGKPAADNLPLVRLYRAHRDAGKDSDTAAASALAGEQP